MRTALILAVISLTLPALLLAGTTGKIRGLVTERASGEGLAGANVSVVGTQLGAATEVDGEYIILNVPPGTYELRATMVGYGPVTVRQVRVVADQTTTIDAQMSESAVQLADVIVQAERPMVQRDLTATQAVVSQSRSSSFRSGTSRRSCRFRPAWWVTGTRCTSAGAGAARSPTSSTECTSGIRCSGTLGTAINNDAIAELNTLSGTFNAEYGNALSGVVNIVTKEGGSRFAGSFEARTSEFWLPPFLDPNDQHSSQYAEMRENRVAGTIGGPITGDDFTFFASGERDARSSWLPYGSESVISGIAKLADASGPLPESRDHRPILRDLPPAIQPRMEIHPGPVPPPTGVQPPGDSRS